MIEPVSECTPKLSALLIVQNEAHCLARCLQSVAPIADEIIMLDSGSRDATLSIAQSFGVNVEVTEWPGFGPQRNRALGHARGKWVLAIDADEHVTPELAASIRAIIESTNGTANGYFIRFLATWCGKRVRFGDWAGKRHLRLFRRGYAQFSDDAVHERVICRPPTATLDGLMIHDTVASKDEAMEKCHRYARLSAQSLAAQGRGGLLPALLHSAWTLFRGSIVKGGCLDGAVGWQVAFVTAKGTWLRYRIAGELMTANRRNGATCA